MFVWGDIKDTDGDIVWGLLWKWYDMHYQCTVFRLCLCGQGDCLVVILESVVEYTILLLVPVYLAIILCCYIRLSIFLCCMIFCSRRRITYWWRLRRSGIGQVRRVLVWMHWVYMGDLSCLYVYIAVSFHLVNVLLGIMLLAEYSWVGILTYCSCINNGLVDFNFTLDMLNRVFCFGYYMLSIEESSVSGSIRVVTSPV